MKRLEKMQVAWKNFIKNNLGEGDYTLFQMRNHSISNLVPGTLKFKRLLLEQEKS